jgi:Icc-related predicted phosphoesterase
MIHVVSDLHGAQDALRKAVPEGSNLLLLGDLINFLDYTTMTGILCEVFSPEPVKRVAELRAEGRLEEARKLIQERSAGREDEVRRLIGQKVLEQYEAVFEAMPDPTYLILGNVDRPELAASFAAKHPNVHLVDGQVLELEGERFGFAGGALPTELNVGGEITPEEMRAKLEGLGEVDVLCTHIPPAVPELCYDTLARHAEKGSDDILDYINDTSPRVHYFGHVHQPLVSSLYVGRTLCVNVGYFRATKRAWPHSALRISG